MSLRTKNVWLEGYRQTSHSPSVKRRHSDNRKYCRHPWCTRHLRRVGYFIEIRIVLVGQFVQRQNEVAFDHSSRQVVNASEIVRALDFGQHLNIFKRTEMRVNLAADVRDSASLVTACLRTPWAISS